MSRNYLLERWAVDHLTDDLDRVGVLGDPLRRSLYAHVAGQPDAISREHAANALGLALHTVRFHLDRLVEAGLLDVEFRQLSGRRGPGSGRPSKLYRRSERQLSVSLPERRYDVVGEVLAEAVDRSVRDASPVAEVLPVVAHEAGLRLGAEAERGEDDGDELATVAGVLGSLGYEPVVDGTEVALANCPFDRLAAGHTDLVCGLNRDLVEGVLEGAAVSRLTARLVPHDTMCCVRVEAAR